MSFVNRERNYFWVINYIIFRFFYFIRYYATEVFFVVIARVRFKFDSAVHISRPTPRSVTTMPKKSMPFPRRAHANVIVDGIVDVASLDVASQGPHGATRVALSNTIFWSVPRTAIMRRVKTGENHPARRIYRPRTVGAAQRRDASQLASQPGVHCAPPFEQERSPRVRGKKISRPSRRPEIFLFRLTRSSSISISSCYPTICGVVSD